MTQARASAYRDYMATWLGDLTKIHLEAHPWPNCHMALHIYDFLLLFGPIHSWWCFPFEWLIGQLQWLPSNHKLGMTDCFLSYMLLMTPQERWKAHYFVLSSEPQAFGGGLAGQTVPQLFKSAKPSLIRHMLLTWMVTHLQPISQCHQMSHQKPYLFLSICTIWLTSLKLFYRHDMYTIVWCVQGPLPILETVLFISMLTATGPCDLYLVVSSTYLCWMTGYALPFSANYIYLMAHPIPSSITPIFLLPCTLLSCHPPLRLYKLTG